ncbi:MAG: 4-alpha-glucanotransferase [Sulfitobacter sp.]
MTADAKLAALAKRAGILPSYVDMQGVERITSPQTQRALLAAIGFDVATDADVQASLTSYDAETAKRTVPEEVIVESANAQTLDFGAGVAWKLRSDDGIDEVTSGIAQSAIELPPLKSGVYELSVGSGADAQMVRVVAAPHRLTSVETLTGMPRLWGINLALYGLRSKRNSGLGDFEDLAGVAEIAGAHGAAFVGVNPIHNMGFSDVSISPYSPSHRGFLNTSHIALDAIPGLEKSPHAKQVLAREAISIIELRGDTEVPHVSHKALHNRLLTALFDVFKDAATKELQVQLDTFRTQGGAELETFAKFETLSEENGPDWRKWGGAKTPADPTRIEFHIWLQWVADCQLNTIQQRAKAADLSLGLYLDLAVGPRRNGAESWCEQASIAQGVSIGAPPDHLSPEGQNWDLAAFSPRKLQQQNYRPFRRILAQIMRHAGVVRIDHVLGLNRSFLIPDDGSPGGYVTQPFDALMAVIKIEAERHNCAVIGEDLGLVPKGFRAAMQEHGFYGYSVLQYEKDEDGAFTDPAKGRAQVLSCFSTHDTPTLKGYETGTDIGWWQRLGWIASKGATAARKERRKDIAALKKMSGTTSDFASSVHAILARSPAKMVSVQLDDILGLSEAQNLPGTIDAHPNWRRKYDISLDQLAQFGGLKQLGTIMAQARNTHMEDALHDISNS